MRTGMLRTVLACCCLIATATTASQAATSGSAEAAFAYGLRAYNHAEYKEAAARFVEAVAADPDDGTARYWLGLAYLKLGNDRAAADQIEAGLRAKRPPSIERARVLADLGAAQLAAGDAAAAEKTLAEAIQANPDDASSIYLLGVARARLGRMEEGRVQAEKARALDPTLPELPERTVAPGTGGEVVAPGQPFWEIRVGAGYGPDSNPSSIGDDLLGFDPSDPNQRVDGNDQATTADLRLEIHPFYDAAGWSLGLRLEGSQSIYDDLSLFDYGRGAAAAQLAWGKDPLGYVTGPMGYTRVPFGTSRATFLLQTGVSYDQVDHESYVRTYEGAASTTIREGRNMATQVDLDYVVLNYEENPTLVFDPSDLSGHEVGLKASQYFYGARRDRYVRVGLRRGESRRDVTDDQFDSSSIEADLELSLPLHRNLGLFVAGDWREDDFSAPVAGEDFVQTTVEASAALIWAFSGHFYLTARGTYVDRSVEDGVPVLVEDLFEYDRVIGSLNVTWFY